MNTLAYVQSSPFYSERDEIKQMVGEAQRVAQRNGRTGDIEVLSISGSTDRNEYESKVLIYNTQTRNYCFTRR